MEEREKTATSLQFLDLDITERNVSVIALEKNRAGLIDFGVEFAASSFGAFDVVVNFYSVESERYFISDDGCLGRLPFVAGFGDKFVGRFEIVDGAIAVDGVGATSVIAQDLKFVASAKVESAVGFVWNHIFKSNGEVPELLVRDQIVSMKLFIGGVFQDAVFDGPTVATVRMAKMPAGGVFAVEERTEAAVISGESDGDGGD